MVSKKNIDATQGNLIKLMFSFAIPLILTTLSQDLFNITDKAVLGNMAGSTAVASVGATTTITSLIINGAVGLSTGASIVLARFVGQKNQEEIRATIDTSLLTGFFIGVLVAVFGNLLAPTFLTATNCPSECYDGALLYLRIYISGAPFTLFYNYSAAVLRTLGDTRRPLFYIIVSGFVNVCLNVILCLILPQKVAAVAIATIVSKIISSLLIAKRFLSLEDDTRVVLKNIRFSKDTFGKIFRIGVPVSLSNIIIPLANLQIVSAVNSFGVNAVAGNSAALSINTIANAFAAGFSVTTTTFMGQNIGAKNVSRVKRSFWYGLCVNVLITGSLSALMYLTGEFWLRLILGKGEDAAVEYGMIRMLYVLLFMFLLSANKTLTSALQAFGYPFLTSATNIFFTLGFRIVWMQVLYPKYPTFDMIMLCFTVSWATNLIFYLSCFSVIYWRYVKKGICKKI